MILGIDTSNYKTSIAVTTMSGRVIADSRRFLTVKSGERGLRQSEAFFQHINRLPELLDEALKQTRDNKAIFAKVVISTRPRSVEGSYMPCFLAGQSFGTAFARGAGAEIVEVSHQDGHLAAVHLSHALKQGKTLDEGFLETSSFAAFHFSGGTTEALICKPRFDERGVPTYDAKIVGGTKDISYGQVLDRIGVARGLEFPCGSEMDKIALGFKAPKGFRNNLPKIKVKDGFVNLSGIETSCQRKMDDGFEEVCYEAFIRVCESILEMVYQIHQKEGIRRFYFAGGVSSSLFLRNFINKNLDEKLNLEIIFAEPELSSDNAVGLAMLGGLSWHKNRSQFQV